MNTLSNCKTTMRFKQTTLICTRLYTFQKTHFYGSFYRTFLYKINVYLLIAQAWFINMMITIDFMDGSIEWGQKYFKIQKCSFLTLFDYLTSHWPLDSKSRVASTRIFFPICHIVKWPCEPPIFTFACGCTDVLFETVPRGGHTWNSSMLKYIPYPQSGLS